MSSRACGALRAPLAAKICTKNPLTRGEPLATLADARRVVLVEY